MFFLMTVIAFCTTYWFLSFWMFKMLLFFIHIKCLDFLTSNTSLRTKLTKFRQLNPRQLSQQPEQPNQDEFPGWINTSPALKVQFVCRSSSELVFTIQPAQGWAPVFTWAGLKVFSAKLYQQSQKFFFSLFFFLPPLTRRYDPWFLC